MASLKQFRLRSLTSRGSQSSSPPSCEQDFSSHTLRPTLGALSATRFSTAKAVIVLNVPLAATEIADTMALGTSLVAMPTRLAPALSWRDLACYLLAPHNQMLVAAALLMCTSRIGLVGLLPLLTSRSLRRTGRTFYPAL
jgi:hypothetical protein